MSADVLVVEDEADLRAALCETLRIAGFRAIPAADGKAAIDISTQHALGLVVSDVQMNGVSGMDLLRRVKSTQPEVPVLLMTAYGTIEQAVTAMQEGAADYLVKPFDAEVLVSKVSALLDRDEGAGHELVAVDPQSRELVSLAKRVAKNEVTVLITGESGTGKEVLARFIHAESGRGAHPFVAINCAAIPENMLEAVLFGYEKGSFTGAHKACPGKFEQAQSGTLLLDEISEMALSLQAKLLRVLQEREVERLGGKEMIPLDVRVIATSNRDMQDAVASGAFREDLYYRLNVFPLYLPPLRARVDDIVPIAERLIARTVKVQGRRTPALTAQAKRRLLSHSWPGNVRELDNTLQRALVLQSGSVIDALDLDFEPPRRSAPVLAAGLRPAARDTCPSSTESLGDELRTQEHRLILDVLESEAGNRRAAAERLGISPRTLRYKLARMRESGLAVPSSGL